MYKDRILVLHIASEPTRNKALNLLPSYANAIAHILKENPKNIAFHLAKLEEYGLAESHFELEQVNGGRPVATRKFKLTDAGKEMKQALLNWERSK